MNEREIKEQVKQNYGRIAQESGSHNISSGCGCNTKSLSELSLLMGYNEKELKNIPKESNMGLGCGNPTALASLKKGETVLDLGSGGGIDAFLAAQKVGETGYVIGVDMTKEMIQKAKTTAKKNCYNNVDFRLGEIENLPIEDNSIDVIISNCVINLSPNKKKVFQEAYRVLKPNGRILISDIVTEGNIPEQLQKNISAWVGCVSGALEKSQYLSMIKKSGFEKVKIASEKSFSIKFSKKLEATLTSVQIEAQKK